jgi:low affinity Fe/Cu permease
LHKALSNEALKLLRDVARRAPEAVGSPWTFVVAVAATLGWLISGGIVGWSGAWVLWPATLTSIGAFLLVLLLQYSQNRDTRALQLKLDEIIRAVGAGRIELLRLERRSDEELEQIEAEFEELREREAEAG